jgi:hypothetical protein
MNADAALDLLGIPTLRTFSIHQTQVTDLKRPAHSHGRVVVVTEPR